METIFFTSHIAQTLADFLKHSFYSQIMILTDEHTLKHCYPLIQPSLPEHHVITIPSGEANKNLQTCTQIWQAMTANQLDRKAVLVNLGGGVIGDMGGFCAATYKRGIDFVQIPTTLLSMVDASVGGKLGIDFQGFKNHIGVFQEPVRVLIDVQFLRTLPQREIRSGFAEIIKHSLIADIEQWVQIRQNTNIQDLEWLGSLIAHSVHIKFHIVSEDPTEKGRRKILNFGHTIGHAIETYFLTETEQTLLHGEAIAIGMICESYLSFQKQLISEEEFTEILAYLWMLFPQVNISQEQYEPIASLAQQDKKNEQNTIQCTLLNKIGQTLYNQPITQKEIIQSLLFYTQLSTNS